MITNLDTIDKANISKIGKKAKPFLKWVGGKQQLIKQFNNYFPNKFKRYFEPFVGGAAVFFHLWNTSMNKQDFFLFDNNEELVNTYKIVKNKVEELIQILASYKENHNKTYYYKIRELDRNNSTLNDVEKAARMIYLNKTCFNGLYRVNKSGQFNVPIGSYEEPQILYPKILRNASVALKDAIIEVSDFEDIVKKTEVNDFVYFDPPYVPISKTSNFTSYTSGNFGEKEQLKLAQLLKVLTEQGCFCMLSNSYSPLVLDLYKDFRIEIVKANRAVNSNGNNRGRIKEIIVLNY